MVGEGLDALFRRVAGGCEVAVGADESAFAQAVRDRGQTFLGQVIDASERLGRMSCSRAALTGVVDLQLPA